MFLIPRLINNLEESTGSNVIWINDAVNIAQYKSIEQVIFLGLHPVSKIPYLLNYAASETNVELNFEITTVWGLLRDWIYKEKISLDSAGLNDKIRGNYILQFNYRYELVYLNEFNKQDMDPYFNFPVKIERQADLSLEKIMRHKTLFDQISEIVTSLVDLREKEADISKPEVNVRVVLDEKGRLKSFFMIFRSRAMQEVRMSDPFADFEYAITPLSIIRNEEPGDDIMLENNRSVYSNKDMAFSNARRATFNQKNTVTKPSNFGNKKNKESSRKSVIELGSSLVGDQLDPNYIPGGKPSRPGKKGFLIKQDSRFTHEGSLFSEQIQPGNIGQGPRSYNLSAMKSTGQNVASPNNGNSNSKYKMIEERVNRSIVMEYMQGNQLRVGQIKAE